MLIFSSAGRPAFEFVAIAGRAFGAGRWLSAVVVAAREFHALRAGLRFGTVVVAAGEFYATGFGLRFWAVVVATSLFDAIGDADAEEEVAAGFVGARKRAANKCREDCDGK